MMAIFHSAGDARQGARGEKSSTVLSICESGRLQYQPGREDTSTGAAMAWRCSGY